MSTFWKPISSTRQDRRSPHKTLGHGLYELWARCDLCGRSNPLAYFVELERGADTAQLCNECLADDQNVQAVRGLGWSIR